MTGRTGHWADFWKNQYAGTGYANNYGAHVYRLEAHCAKNELGKYAREARVLSLGTGLGQVELQVLTETTPSECSHLVATDLISDALIRFRQSVHLHGIADRVGIIVADAHHLPFANGCFDAVLSFGRACVGAYPSVAPELSRVLAPDGVVIMDFVNHLSLYEWLKSPIKQGRRLKSFLGGANTKYHHFGVCGIRRFYRAHGIDLMHLFRLGAAPPLGNTLSPHGYQAIERIWPLKRLWARVLIGVFVKRAD